MDDTENNNADLICKEEYPCIKVKPKKGDPDMASMHAG